MQEMRCQVRVHGEQKQDLLRRIAFSARPPRSVHEQCSLIVDEWLDRQLAKPEPGAAEVAEVA